MKLLTIILILSFSFSAQAANEIDAKLKAAMTAESRPQGHIDRDKNRKPLATLNFFRLKDNMRVLELIPGGGWYTRLLAPVLAENGKFYVAIGTNYVKQNIIGKPNFEKISKKINSKPNGFVTQVIHDVSQVRRLSDHLTPKNFQIIPCVLYPSSKNSRSAEFLNLDWSNYESDFASFVHEIESVTGDVLVTSPNDFKGALDFLTRLQN